MCALSAGWTGSCQPDEGEVSRYIFRIPLATHRQKRTTCLRAAFRTTAKEVFLWRDWNNYFEDSFSGAERYAEDGSGQLCLWRLLLFPWGFYRLQLTEFIRIGFDFLPKEMAAMLFRPLQAACGAAFTDIISYALKPIRGIFPGLTFSAMLASLFTDNPSIKSRFV